MYQGKSIRLRPFEKSDLKKYREWINSSEVAPLVDRVLPVSELEHEKWYASIIENRNSVFFAIENTDSSQYVGNIWLWDIDSRHRKAEVRILIGEPSAVNKGMGTEALNMISWYGFEKLNLHRLFAYVLSSNSRAIKAFEKAGFISEGMLLEDRFVNGVYENVVVMARIKR